MIQPEKHKELSKDPWASASFEGNLQEQLREGAKMSFAEKVAWLEEGHRLVIELEKARLTARPIGSNGPKLGVDLS